MILVVLVLMAGVGIDVGFLHYEKQQMQKAADAAALAGAATLIYSGQGQPVTIAARNDASANGFANGVNNVTVTVNNPPLSGIHAGNANYVEVYVAKPISTFFMKVASGFSFVNVRSRSVASAIGSASGCIYTLDPVDGQTLVVDSGVRVATGCGIRVASSNNSALVNQGVLTTTAKNTPPLILVGIVGEYSGSGTYSPTAPVTGIANFLDPLALVPAPTFDRNNCSGGTNFTISSGHIPQGNYCNGITITGSGTVTFDTGGTYILLGGGLTATGYPQLNGTNVLFYNTYGNPPYSYGDINLTAASGSTLSAPTTGPQAGILFFQDRTVSPVGTGSSFDASAGASFNGALYFSNPNQTTTHPLTYKGPPANIASNTIIVAWALEFKGNAPNFQGYTQLPGFGGSLRSPIATAAIVE